MHFHLALHLAKQNGCLNIHLHDGLIYIELKNMLTCVHIFTKKYVILTPFPSLFLISYFLVIWSSISELILSFSFSLYCIWNGLVWYGDVIKWRITRATYTTGERVPACPNYPSLMFVTTIRWTGKVLETNPVRVFMSGDLGGKQSHAFPHKTIKMN